VLVYGFNKNHKFGAKNDGYSSFLCRDPHIADRWYITVPNMSFYGFSKISNFSSKSIGVSIRFYRKWLVWDKNGPKLCISRSWPLYCESFIHNGLIYDFLWVLKKLNFRSKSIDVSLRFTKNRQFWAKTEQNSVFLGHDTHIADKLYITVSYMIFYGFSKNSNFRSKSIGVSLRFYKKSTVLDKNWSKLRISWLWPSYCVSVIQNGPVYELL
jgi:hypothetical protein